MNIIPDHERIARVLRHYVDQQIEAGALATDVIVALEETQKHMENAYVKSGITDKDIMSAARQVSELCQRISGENR